ncbi:retrovirus-related Pol polyprotein from transposon 412 [Trichonephila clavipes]|nr:retrovirus-related Pol polyprotein from transposon 412 [Trichonephila clavipes]
MVKDGYSSLRKDCTTKWVELFALPNDTAKECAITLIEEVLLRYGIPRRLISDNGTQFASAVMQQICYLLNIHQSLIPVYHPQANPVERKNRDLKPHGWQFSSKTSMTVGQRSYPSSALLSTQPNAKRQDKWQPF